MKKIISFLIVIITLFNFIFCNIAFADTDVDGDLDVEFNENSTFNIDEDDFTPAGIKDLAEKGLATDKTSSGKSVMSQLELHLLDKITLRIYCRNIS